MVALDALVTVEGAVAAGAALAMGVEEQTAVQ